MSGNRHWRTQEDYANGTALTFVIVPSSCAMSATIVVLAVSRWQEPDGRAADQDRPQDQRALQEARREGFIKKFESDDREVFAKRHEIVAALGLRPGMAVADVGAGTGLFTRLFAEKVGKTGKVYAVDIAPRFLAHIAAEAKKHGQTQVVTVQGSQESTNLPQ